MNYPPGVDEFTPENDRKTTAPCKFRARSKEARTIASPRALQLERSKARVVDVFSGVKLTATGGVAKIGHEQEKGKRKRGVV